MWRKIISIFLASLTFWRQKRRTIQNLKMRVEVIFKKWETIRNQKHYYKNVLIVHHNNSVYEYVFNLVVWLWSQIVVVCCCWLSLCVPRMPECWVAWHSPCVPLSCLMISLQFCAGHVSNSRDDGKRNIWQLKNENKMGCYLQPNGGRGERALHSEWTEGFEETIKARRLQNYFFFRI